MDRNRDRRRQPPAGRCHSVAIGRRNRDPGGQCGIGHAEWGRVGVQWEAALRPNCRNPNTPMPTVSNHRPSQSGFRGVSGLVIDFESRLDSMALGKAVDDFKRGHCSANFHPRPNRACPTHARFCAGCSPILPAVEREGAGCSSPRPPCCLRARPRPPTTAFPARSVWSRPSPSSCRATTPGFVE